MIGFDHNTQTTPGSQYINDAGVYSATLSGVVFAPAKKDGSGESVLQFFFRTADGRELPKKIRWSVDEQREQQNAVKDYPKYQQEGKADKRLNKLLQLPDTTILSPTDYTRARVARAWEQLGAEVKGILEGYVPADKLMEVRGADYADFSQKVVQLASQHLNGSFKLALLLFDDKNYVKFPSYPPFFFTSEDAALEHARKKAFKMEKTEATPESQFGGGGYQQVPVNAADGDTLGGGNDLPF